jgi:hypothetical protein
MNRPIPTDSLKGDLLESGLLLYRGLQVGTEEPSRRQRMPARDQLPSGEPSYGKACNDEARTAASHESL